MFFKSLSSPPLFIYACLKILLIDSWLPHSQCCSHLPGWCVSSHCLLARSQTGPGRWITLSKDFLFPNMWHRCASGPLLLTSPPAFFIDIHPVFVPEIQRFIFWSLLFSPATFIFRSLPPPGRAKGPRERQIPLFPSSHCSWPQGGRCSAAAVPLWLLWLSYSDYSISCKNMRPLSVGSSGRLSIKPTLQSENIFCCGSTFFSSLLPFQHLNFFCLPPPTNEWPFNFIRGGC